MLRNTLAAVALVSLAAAFPARAEIAVLPPLVVPAGGVVTLDQDVLFERSAFGRRVASWLEAETAELAAENRALEASLAAEERALTDRRPELDPAEFRDKADAFDAMVVETRARQDRKAVEISRRLDAERARFFEAALPVLLELMAETGARIVLDSRLVLLSLDASDITEPAIRRIDDRIGAGEPAPE